MAENQPSEEQIAEWKRTYGELSLIEHEDGTWCIISKPNRITLDAFFANSKNMIKAVETVIKNCWVVGDESFKTDVHKILSAAEHIEALIDVKKSSLKKL